MPAPSRFLIRAFASAVLSICLAAQSVDPARLDAIIEETRKAFQAPGIVVGIVKDGQVVYVKGHGFKRAGHPDAVTPDTRFAIGSATKAFTTTAMAMLVDDGKLAWDDPVRKHYPTFRLSDPLADRDVTLRDIVSHRTGLSRHDALWYGTTLGRDEIIRRIGLVPLTRQFREAYQYQNIMYLTAGQVVGGAAGTTWEAFVAARILKPLGMANTDLSANDVQKAPDYATPHVKRKDAVIAIPWRNIDNVAPAGAINSSMGDLLKWLRFQLAAGAADGVRLVSQKQLAETHAPQMIVREDGPSRELNPDTNMSAYGLGWRLQDYRGYHMVAHGGAIDGFRSQVAMLPKQKLGLVILANLGNNNLPEALRFSLFDALLGLPARDWNKIYLDAAATQEAESKKRLAEREEKRIKGTTPARDLAAYAGTYENPAYGAARVSLAGGSLVIDWERAHLPLRHFHFDTFQAPDDDSTFANLQATFNLNPAGQPATLLFLDQEFRRPPSPPSRPVP